MAQVTKVNKILNAFEKAQTKHDISRLTRESVDWFFKFVRLHVKDGTNFGTMKPHADTVTKPIPGKFYLYEYDPKHKETLPYYDKLPLVLITSLTPNGWYGINFHYMPYKVRALVMAEMIDTINNATYTNRVKLKMNWKKALKLSKAVGQDKYLKHSIKQYLALHTQTKLLELDSTVWELTLFLPLSKFEKKSSRSIWAAV